MWSLFKKKRQLTNKQNAVSDDDYAKVRHLIDTAFVPVLNSSLANFNTFLLKRFKIQVAIDIQWIIQKVD